MKPTLPSNSCSVEPIARRVDLSYWLTEPIPLPNLQWSYCRRRERAGIRPDEESWVQNRVECVNRPIIAFPFKRWGGVNKRATGRQLNGRTFDALPTERVTRMSNAEFRNGGGETCFAWSGQPPFPATICWAGRFWSMKSMLFYNPQTRTKT